MKRFLTVFLVMAVTLVCASCTQTPQEENSSAAAQSGIGSSTDPASASEESTPVTSETRSGNPRFIGYNFNLDRLSGATCQIGDDVWLLEDDGSLYHLSLSSDGKDGFEEDVKHSAALAGAVPPVDTQSEWKLTAVNGGRWIIASAGRGSDRVRYVFDGKFYGENRTECFTLEDFCNKYDCIFVNGGFFRNSVNDGDGTPADGINSFDFGILTEEHDGLLSQMTLLTLLPDWNKIVKIYSDIEYESDYEGAPDDYRPYAMLALYDCEKKTFTKITDKYIEKGEGDFNLYIYPYDGLHFIYRRGNEIYVCNALAESRLVYTLSENETLDRCFAVSGYAYFVTYDGENKLYSLLVYNGSYVSRLMRYSRDDDDALTEFNIFGRRLTAKTKAGEMLIFNGYDADRVTADKLFENTAEGYAIIIADGVCRTDVILSFMTDAIENDNGYPCFTDVKFSQKEIPVSKMKSVLGDGFSTALIGNDAYFLVQSVSGDAVKSALYRYALSANKFYTVCTFDINAVEEDEADTYELYRVYERENCLEMIIPEEASAGVIDLKNKRLLTYDELHTDPLWRNTEMFYGALTVPTLNRKLRVINGEFETWNGGYSHPTYGEYKNIKVDAQTQTAVVTFTNGEDMRCCLYNYKDASFTQLFTSNALDLGFAYLGGRYVVYASADDKNDYLEIYDIKNGTRRETKLCEEIYADIGEMIGFLSGAHYVELWYTPHMLWFNGRIYYPDVHGNIYAVDPDTGESRTVMSVGGEDVFETYFHPSEEKLFIIEYGGTLSSWGDLICDYDNGKLYTFDGKKTEMISGTASIILAGESCDRVLYFDTAAKKWVVKG